MRPRSGNIWQDAHAAAALPWEPVVSGGGRISEDAISGQLWQWRGGQSVRFPHTHTHTLCECTPLDKAERLTDGFRSQNISKRFLVLLLPLCTGSSPLDGEAEGVARLADELHHLRVGALEHVLPLHAVDEVVDLGRGDKYNHRMYVSSPQCRLIANGFH